MPATPGLLEAECSKRTRGLPAQSLEEINNYIRDNDTPYLGGERPNARDLELAPNVYHVQTAMRHYKVGTSQRDK